MINENSNVKEWYLKEYTEDTDGKYINEDITFYDIFYALDTYKDIYEVIGNDCDSVIRERIFIKLAEIIGVDYDYIYNQWLMGK